MNLKKSLLVAVPALAMAVGALAFSFTASKKGAIEADAADYSISNRGLTINNDKSISATFTVSNSDLNMQGWLLCLFNAKPEFNPSTRKLTNSDDLHPYSVANCSHYFFVSNATKTGTVEVTWAANSPDAKEVWNENPDAGKAGHTLKDYLEEDDWYFVIGPRHIYYGTHEGIGAGNDNIWENCDYYVGRKSTFDGDFPSGQIYLDLIESDYWENDDDKGKVKFGVYFWDENNKSDNDFSSFAVETGENSHVYVASYELDFIPTNMLAVRFKSDATEPSWDVDWNNCKDLSFYENGVIGVVNKNSSDLSWSCALATLKGLDNSVVLDHYQRSGGESEHYNTSVFLQAGDEFTVSFGGNDSFNSFTNHYYLDGVFTKVNNKIHVGQTGEYSLYFKTTGNNESLYITNRKYAAAENWARSFITNDENDKCDHTKGLWAYWKDNSSQNTYYDLSDDVQDLFKNADHIDHSVNITDRYIEQAIQRYDYILEIYGTNPYYDFMERVEAGKVKPKQSSISKTVINGDNTMMIATIVSMISVAGLGAFLFYKKKRVQD